MPLCCVLQIQHVDGLQATTRLGCYHKTPLVSGELKYLPLIDLFFNNTTYIMFITCVKSAIT